MVLNTRYLSVAGVVRLPDSDLIIKSKPSIRLAPTYKDFDILQWKWISKKRIRLPEINVRSMSPLIGGLCPELVRNKQMKRISYGGAPKPVLSAAMKRNTHRST